MYKLISNLDLFARVEYRKECKMMCIDKYNGAYLGNFENQFNVAISLINTRFKNSKPCV